MSYATGEAQIMAIIADMPDFRAGNVSRADWKPLNSGNAPHYAILKPGSWSNEPSSLSAGAAITTWRTVIEVWRRWVDDAPTAAGLQELVGRLIDYLDRHPSLDGMALQGWVTGGSDMQQRWLREGGPMWAVWEVYIDWQEERFIDYDG